MVRSLFVKRNFVLVSNFVVQTNLKNGDLKTSIYVVCPIVYVFGLSTDAMDANVLRLGEVPAPLKVPPKR